MVSDADYGVVVRHDATVETRDGTGLATDIYRPAEPGSGEPIAEPKPALLVRTPYDKRERERVERQGNWYAERGYVVAIQDVRGRSATRERTPRPASRFRGVLRLQRDQFADEGGQFVVSSRVLA